MEKIEALANFLNCSIDDIKETEYGTFEHNSKEWSVYNDVELEKAAKANIEMIFEDCYRDEKDLAEWVDKNGGLYNFINDSVLSDTIYELENDESFMEDNGEYFEKLQSDEEIFDYLMDMEYFDYVPFDWYDMDKLVNYVYEADGAICLAGYDGELNEYDDYTIIRVN